MRTFCFLFIVSVLFCIACAGVPERDADLALREQQRRVEVFPENPAEKLRLGGMLAARGYHGGALEAWREGFGQSKNDPRFLRRIADLQYEMGLERAAIESFERYLFLTNGDAELFYRLGWAYLHVALTMEENVERTIRLRKALEQLRQYQLLRPRLPEGHLGVGVAQLHLADADPEQNASLLAMAKDAFEKVLEIDSQNRRGLFNLAQVWEREEKWQRAVESYRRIFFQRVGDAKTLVNLALLYLRLQRPAAAKPLLELALRYEPDSRRQEEIQKQLDSLAADRGIPTMSPGSPGAGSPGAGSPNHGVPGADMPDFKGP